MAEHEKLKAYRTDKGWTQEFVAKKIGKSLSFYSKLESGDRYPSQEVAKLINILFNSNLFNEAVPFNMRFYKAKKDKDFILKVKLTPEEYARFLVQANKREKKVAEFARLLLDVGIKAAEQKGR